MAPTLAAVLCLPSAMHAQQATDINARSSSAFANTDTARTIPLVMSFSGGISLGSYQAGVNWGLIQFINMVRQEPNYRASRLLPHLEIAAMTGASAGNINALLAAMQYCSTVTHEPATASLFWKAWVSTGWNQLFPPSALRAASEHGVFDRRHFHDYIEPAVAQAMEQPTYQRGCKVPLGIVVTKLIPTRIPLDDKAAVATQRHVALFDAREAGGTMRFVPPHRYLLADPSLGAQIGLPVEDDGVIRPTSIFSVVEASSAFPVAFAPVLISYMEAACEATRRQQSSCPVGAPQSFIDGGVFDNNPMGLALGMARDAIARDTTIPDTLRILPHLIYVDPNALREPWRSFAAARAFETAETRDYGVSAVLQLLTGFVPTAREYELQLLARSLRVPSAGAPDSLLPIALVGSTSRAHPLIGEHLGQFAAFLGVPFREFDFWVGVTDAIHFVTNQVLCQPARLDARTEPHRRVPDPLLKGRTDQHACARLEADDLVATRLTLGTAGSEIVSRIRHREDPTVPIQRVSDNARDDMTRVLDAIERATASRMEYRDPPVCGGNLAHDLMCSDEFDTVLRQLRQDTASVEAIVDRWARSEGCNAGAESSGGEVCLAEPILAQLLQDQESAMQEIIDDVFSRMQVIEDSRGTNRNQRFKAPVKAAEFLYRSTDHIYRRGWRFDPSSIPPHDSGPWPLMHLLPYFVGGGLGSDGFVFGWEPMIHINNHLATAFPLEVSDLPRELAALPHDSWYEALSPSLVWKTPFLILSELRAGPRFMTRPDHPLDPWQSPTFEAGALLLAGKLRLTAFRAPQLLGAGRSYRWLGNISLADANGIVYWLFR